MNDILKEIIYEASKNNLTIDGDYFPIAFNTIIYEGNQELLHYCENEDYPTLIIKDWKKTISKLEEYVALLLEKNLKYPSFSKEKDKNCLKLAIAFLFVNGNSTDFVNPLFLIERYIAFLRDSTFAYLDEGMIIPLETLFFGSQLEVKNITQSVFMETTQRIDISLLNQINGVPAKYVLPSISYGIRVNDKMEKECYIYSLLHPKTTLEETPEQVKYTKKIARELYKLNAGVLASESEEYHLNNNHDYYAENISDVSPSAVLSLIIFYKYARKRKYQAY